MQAGKFIMRITIQEEAPKSITLKIEGRVTGATVPELNRAWQDLATSLGTRKLSVDLRGVTFIDTAGRTVLAEIHSKTNADFLADTPMTKYFADEAKRSIGEGGQ
jgi:anti-anti-sigma regulatory factor